jgi:hypothetical protein
MLRAVRARRPLVILAALALAGCGRSSSLAPNAGHASARAPAVTSTTKVSFVGSDYSLQVLSPGPGWTPGAQGPGLATWGGLARGGCAATLRVEAVARRGHIQVAGAPGLKLTQVPVLGAGKESAFEDTSDPQALLPGGLGHPDFLAYPSPDLSLVASVGFAVGAHCNAPGPGLTTADERRATAYHGSALVRVLVANAKLSG